MARAPRLPLNAMEIGPTTVTGIRPTMVDPVVQELGDVLEGIARKTGTCDFEVEVRLGTVSAKRSISGDQQASASASNRISLPIKTEAPLHKADGFDFHFAPGLTRESFSRLDRRLRGMCTSGQIKCMFEHDYTADDYYQVPGYGDEYVRVTYDLNDEANDEPARSFVKHKHWTLDLWSGQKAPQHGPVFDYRMAVNTEEILDDFTISPGHVFKFRRKKRRSTYQFRAWKIDLTVVSTHADPRSSDHARHSYEVEIELVTSALADNIRHRAAEKQHKLWELLTDFLNFARDLAVLAGELDPVPIPPSLPLLQDTAAIISKSDRAAFSDVYGDLPEPVIGHYLYRLAASSGALPPPSCDVSLPQEALPPKPHMMVSQAPARFNIVTSYPTPAEGRALPGKLEHSEDLQPQVSIESAPPLSPVLTPIACLTPGASFASSTPRGSTPLAQSPHNKRKALARSSMSSQKRPQASSQRFAASPRQGPVVPASPRMAAEAEVDAYMDELFAKKPATIAGAQSPAPQAENLFVMPSSPIIYSHHVEAASKRSPSMVASPLTESPSVAHMESSVDDSSKADVEIEASCLRGSTRDGASKRLKFRKTLSAAKQAPKWADPKALAAVCALPGPQPRA